MAEGSDLVLLCYDGSDDAAAAIAQAATLLRSRHAIVLTAWEEASSWEPFDPATIVLGARGQSRLESVLVGSVCSPVIAHTGRPVLVIENRSKPSASE
jgi:nucleotide-binding universal stress UspA family protein